VATFTIDHLAFSLSPPVIGVIIDFDGGGRYRCELTDARAPEVSIGDRVSMTFRRIWTAQGVHNYFWKARPLFGAAGAGNGDTGQADTGQGGTGQDGTGQGDTGQGDTGQGDTGRGE